MKEYAIYPYSLGPKAAALWAETIFTIHLLWTILLPLNCLLLAIFGLGYLPYFSVYIFLNIFAPMPWRGCPLTLLEKDFRKRAGQDFDIHLTFIQHLGKRLSGKVPPRWVVHTIHATVYVICGAIISTMFF